MSQEEIYKKFDAEYAKLIAKESYTFQWTPEQSEWQCYLFGNRPGGVGIIYRPTKGNEPNWFVRLMMKICFDCLWVKGKV